MEYISETKIHFNTIGDDLQIYEGEIIAGLIYTGANMGLEKPGNQRSEFDWVYLLGISHRLGIVRNEANLIGYTMP